MRRTSKYIDSSWKRFMAFLELLETRWPLRKGPLYVYLQPNEWTKIKFIVLLIICTIQCHIILMICRTCLLSTGETIFRNSSWQTYYHKVTHSLIKKPPEQKIIFLITIHAILVSFYRKQRISCKDIEITRHIFMYWSDFHVHKYER